MCYGILKEAGFEKEFFDEFDKSLEGEKKYLEKDNIYNQLSRIKATFLTTNADEHFDKFFRKERFFYEMDHFKPGNIDVRKLFHIHGIRDPEHRDTLVFTVDKYIQRYKDPKFQEFLREIFYSGKKYVVLFVGYGMSEFELVDFLIQKAGPDSQKSEKEIELRHFILRPYYKSETSIKDFDQHYYKHLGIKVEGYQKDNRGYEQLYEVIKAWSDKIWQVTNVIPDDFQKIEDIIDSYE